MNFGYNLLLKSIDLVAKLVRASKQYVGRILKVKLKILSKGPSQGERAEPGISGLEKQLPLVS